MVQIKEEDKEFDFKFPISQSDVYHHTALSNKGETLPDEWYLWERKFPLRLIDSEKRELNPVPTLLLFFCSQVYNTFLQRELIDVFQREEANKETSHLFSEVGQVRVNNKISFKGPGGIYKEDLDTWVMWSSYKNNDFVVCSMTSWSFILNWVYWWYDLSTRWHKYRKIDFGDGYRDSFIDYFNLILKNNDKLATAFFDWTNRTSLSLCVGYVSKFLDIFQELLSKKTFFEDINERARQRKPFFLVTPGELDDFQLQNYGPQVLEHLAHFNSNDSQKIRRYFAFKPEALLDLPKEGAPFTHIFLDWDQNHPGKKLVNSFPDFCFSTWMINNRERTPFDVIHFDSGFFRPYEPFSESS